MEYVIVVNGRSYDLPKKTMEVVENLDEVLTVDSIKGFTVRQKFEKCHKFIQNLLGKEAAEEMFGSSDITKIDLTEVTLVIQKINAAYLEPIERQQMAQSFAALNNIPIDKITALSNAARTIERMGESK